MNDSGRPIYHCFLLILVGVWLGFAAGPASAQDAMSLFSEYSNRIYQIRIIEEASGKQAALGSGFQISPAGLVVTNYHVVSGYLENPNRYRIEYAAHDGSTGELALVDIDVINDLSLLYRADSDGSYLQLAPSLPVQGESIYSLGNPHDLGMTVVPGTYNGIAAHSLYERIHFSGSINPGMSGGPVLNSRGEVIGVNVSTAGNQISFLVPLERLVELLQRPRQGPIALDQIAEIIGAQLTENQARVFGDLIDRPWLTSPFRGATVPNEIAGYIHCWGSTEDIPDNRFESFMSVCSQDESIFLSDSFNTGTILYQFNWLESEKLNTTQFYNLYESLISNVYPDNYGTRDDVSDFECHEDFVAGNDAPPGSPAVVTKATLCARAYKDYPGLYDVLYLGATVHENRRGLMSHFTLSGVSMEMALAFTRKFLGSVTWN